MLKKIFILLLLSSCSILKPMVHDQGAVDQLKNIQSNVDIIYTHPDFKQDEYTLVDFKIADLISYDSLRANIIPIVNNVKKLQSLVFSIESRHKLKGILNTTLMALYKQQITDKITDIFTAENKLK